MDERTLEQINNYYSTLSAKVEAGRKVLGRAMTWAEKVLWAHLDNPDNTVWEKGKSFLMLRPDRVAMQDATAQMALLQFIISGKPEVAVPSTVHCDHLIQGLAGAKEDLDTANITNKEVYNFLASASQKYGIGFWKPGAGIIHQVVLENYAFPGGLMIGTDSHTPNAGGLGMFACGVGGADAVDVMADFPWEVLQPKIIGVKLTGKLQGWTSPKDVILKICGMLTTKGGTNCVLEYFGEGTKNISCTGKATITNMGAELGATTSIFPYDEKMAEYLTCTGRSQVVASADKIKSELCADADVLANPEKYYDQVVEIDLSTLEPQVVGPHSPDKLHSISELKNNVKSEGYPANLSSCLIGSCTNSSYEDIGRATHVLRQAAEKGLKVSTRFFVSPGSNQVYDTIKRDGYLQTLTDNGAIVLSNSCGPCIGQWKRTDIKKGDVNSIITSFNRNFRARADANPETLAFIGSPETVTAMALAGRLDFNPLTDTLTNDKGEEVMLDAPVADALPSQNFVSDLDGFQPAAEDGSSVTVDVAEGSERLELLTPFEKWDGKDYDNLPVLLKAVGKCTTDHISAAGPWLKFRGHLTNISGNMFLGANNEFTEDNGTAISQSTGEVGSIPDVAKAYRTEGQGWVVFGDENYGEGSSREHAAMCPRLMGCKAVVVRSFARIHETNLKKQGVLPLVFTDLADYEKVRVDDKVAVKGLTELAPGKKLTIVLSHQDGSEESFEVKHSMNDEQIGWFQAGSALNLIRQ